MRLYGRIAIVIGFAGIVSGVGYALYETAEVVESSYLTISSTFDGLLASNSLSLVSYLAIAVSLTWLTRIRCDEKTATLLKVIWFAFAAALLCTAGAGVSTVVSELVTAPGYDHVGIGNFTWDYVESAGFVIASMGCCLLGMAHSRARPLDSKVADGVVNPLPPPMAIEDSSSPTDFR